jgi:hypothetical protein
LEGSSRERSEENFVLPAVDQMGERGGVGGCGCVEGEVCFVACGSLGTGYVKDVFDRYVVFAEIARGRLGGGEAGCNCCE